MLQYSIACSLVFLKVLRSKPMKMMTGRTPTKAAKPKRDTHITAIHTHPTKSLMLGRAERVDPGKDRMSPSGVLHGTSGMKRNQILAISSQLLVDFEGLPRNLLVALLGFVRVDNARKAGVEERKSLATVVAHGNARCWHDRHESIQQKVRCVRGLLFERSSTGNVLNTILGGVEKTVSQSRGHEDASEQSKRFMPVHPKALFRLWCLLGLQDCMHIEKR